MHIPLYVYSLTLERLSLSWPYEIVMMSETCFRPTSIPRFFAVSCPCCGVLYCTSHTGFCMIALHTYMVKADYNWKNYLQTYHICKWEYKLSKRYLTSPSSVPFLQQTYAYPSVVLSAKLRRGIQSWKTWRSMVTLLFWFSNHVSSE